jgi:DNA-binding HxlR family transcriptional regulator
MISSDSPQPPAAVDSSDDQTQAAPSVLSAADPGAPSTDATARLSYKFQRLREKLRQAISSGELNGRLPGERKLARRFRVNAKTLSKALTDLAAEGLLDRSIGRGTFVKGSASSAATQLAEKWLIICEPGQSNSTIIRNLLAANPEAQCSIGMPAQRPSFLSPFKAVIIFSADIPEAFIRDLIVRNIPVVVAGRQPSTFSTHTVLIDRAHGASLIARDLMLDGHRHLAVIQQQGSTELTAAVRHTSLRYAPDAIVETIFATDIPAAIEHGCTAIICDSFDTADTAQTILSQSGLEIPRHVSLAAIGSGNGECHCTGYFVPPSQFSQTIIEILRNNTAKRPVTLFLAGQSIDHSTTGPTDSMIDPTARMRYAPVSA